MVNVEEYNMLEDDMSINDVVGNGVSRPKG